MQKEIFRVLCVGQGGTGLGKPWGLESHGHSFGECFEGCLGTVADLAAGACFNPGSECSGNLFRNCFRDNFSASDLDAISKLISRADLISLFKVVEKHD